MANLPDYENIAINALSEALVNDSDIEVRCAVAESLGKIANEKAIPALLQSLQEDPSPEVRKIVVQAISSILGNKNTQLQTIVFLWKEKLLEYQRQEAINTDPAIRFQLKKLIQECEEKIRELEK
jgi:HEAT repeat protein